MWNQIHISLRICLNYKHFISVIFLHFYKLPMVNIGHFHTQLDVNFFFHVQFSTAVKIVIKHNHQDAHHRTGLQVSAWVADHRHALAVALFPLCCLQILAHLGAMGTYSMLLNCFYHCGSDGKEPACNEGALDSIPGLGRSSGEMAIHSSILAWEIPWTEEPGRLQSMGSQRV